MKQLRRFLVTAMVFIILFSFPVTVNAKSKKANFYRIVLKTSDSDGIAGAYIDSFKLTNKKLSLSGRIFKTSSPKRKGKLKKYSRYSFKITNKTKYYGQDAIGWARITKKVAYRMIKRQGKRNYGFPFVIKVKGKKVLAIYSFS